MIHKNIFCEDKDSFDKNFQAGFSVKSLNFSSKLNAKFTILELYFFSQIVTASKYPQKLAENVLLMGNV